MEMSRVKSGRELRHAVHAFLIVAMVFMYAAAGLELREQHRLTLDAAHTVNLSNAKVLSNHLAHILRTSAFVQDHLLAKIRENGLQSIAGQAGFNELHGLAERFPEIAFVAIIDSTGDFISNSAVPDLPRTNNADREYFIRHLKGEDFVISSPIISRVTGQEVFSVTRAVRDEKRGLQAVINVGIERAYLVDLFKARETEDTVTLIRDDGIILARNPPVAIGEKLPATARIFSLMKKADSGSYESFSPIDGKERLFAFSKASEYPIYLIDSEIKANVLSPWRKNIFRIILILFSATIAIFSAGLLLLRALAREEASRAQMEENKRYQESVLNSIPSHVAILDPDGTIVSTNKSWQDFAIANGYSGTADMAGQNYFAACRNAGGKDAEQVVAGISSVMHGAAPEFRHIYECSSPEDQRWFAMTVTPLLSKPGSVLVSHENVTRLKEAEEVLRERAETDALTGLANRRRFMEQATRDFALARRHHKPLSLLLLDCDHFKKINDTYGHEAGDHVLVALAGEMTRHLRHTDMVGRIGGEEFAIILPETPSQGALAVAEQIRAAIASVQVDTAAGPIRVSASLGVASCSDEIEDLAMLMRAADRALYTAKQAGRNRVEGLASVD